MANEVLDKISKSVKASPIKKTNITPSDAKEGRLIPKEMSTDNMLELLNTRAPFSGSKVYFAKNIEEVKTKIGEIIPRNSNVAAGGRDSLKVTLGCDIEQIIPSTCKYITSDKLASDDELFDLNVAITDVFSCIAETGSIILAADNEYSRLSSLVADIHIAIVRSDQIVPDLVDFAEQITIQSDSMQQGGFTIISGPSKTADIELQLVVGVHGPGQLNIIVMT